MTTKVTKTPNSISSLGTKTRTSAHFDLFTANRESIFRNKKPKCNKCFKYYEDDVEYLQTNCFKSSLVAFKLVLS